MRYVIQRLRNWALLNPLARLGFAAVAGAIIADRGFCDGKEVMLFAAAFVVLSITLVRPRLLPVEWSALLVFACLHQTRLMETSRHPLLTLINADERIEAAVKGYLVPASPTGTPGDGNRQEIMVRAESIDLTLRGKRLKVPAVLRGWMTAKAPLPPAGNYLLEGRLRLPFPPTNPGQFDSAAYALRQGFVAELDVRKATLIEADRWPVYTVFLQMAQLSREWIQQKLAAGIEGEEDALALIHGMALGVTDETSADIQRPFKNTGTLHIFSVSGLHVALISTIGLVCLGAFGMKRTAALFFVIPGVFAYAFITGWRPSAARSAIMVTVFLAAGLFDRKSRIENSLGASAFMLLAMDTQQLFTAGFQLSFGVLYAIALLDRPLVRLAGRWMRMDPFLPPQLAGLRQRQWVALKQKVIGGMCVSTAATAGSLPLMLWHFSLATPVSVIANSLLVPLAFGVLILVCLSIALAVLQLGGALVLANNANWLLASMMLGGAKMFAALPGAWFHWQPFVDVPASPSVNFTVLHLPYGEAAQHLHVNDREWLLDTGSRRGYSQIVQPALQFQCVEDLAGIVLSHSDIDHVGGASRAVSDFADPPVYYSALEPWKHSSGTSALKRLFFGRREDERPNLSLADGDTMRFGADASATLLYPSLKDERGKADDRALVMMLDLKGFKILWCNDSGFIAEKAIMERHLFKALRCDVLVRNQHKEDFSALPDFLIATRPRLVITSNVPYLEEEAMPPSILDYIGRKNAALLDQNVHGAVAIGIEDDALTARAFRTGRVITLENKRVRSRTPASRGKPAVGERP